MKQLVLLTLALSHFILPFAKAASEDSPFISFNNAWSSPFTIDPVYKYHFRNRDGKYLYILNKTAWAFFKCEFPEKVLENVQKHGANVIRVCLEGTPYDQELQLDLWPWGGTRENPNWHSFNQDYLNEVEKRIIMAGEKGIGIALVLYFDLVPNVTDIPNQRPYWDMVISRFGRYSNILTFEIMNEEIGNEVFQDSVGAYFQKYDLYNHPVCSSDGTTEDALWPFKSWMDIAIVHTCTGMQKEYDLEYWYLNIARNIRQYGKPSFNNESGRENRHKNDDPIHRRKQGWLFATAGAFWTWHSWDGCEGINDTTYFASGWQFLKPMKTFFESLHFWELQPNYTACSLRNSNLIHTTLTTSNREFTLMYCCTRATGQRVSNEKAYIKLIDGEYLVQFFSPVDLQEIGKIEMISEGLKKYYEINLPEFTDDLIVEIQVQKEKRKTLIKGTL